MKKRKNERRDLIQQTIHQNPFVTDQALSEMFDVSIQTIRLDRNQMNIPEVRTRIKNVAQEQHKHISALANQDIIGDIIALTPNQSGQSLLSISQKEVFKRKHIARGHVIFAQANSLCVAVINHSEVLTKESHIHFMKPVALGEVISAHANVEQQTDKYFDISVVSYVGDTKVFQGQFKMYYISEDE
ncbi:transcription factor FapR [Staphylococcus sp. 11261D007BR]